MHVLVVGGAGYIGSHMVKLLCQRGFGVTVLDNLSTGYRDAVKGGQFVMGDLGERDVLEELFGSARFDGVMLSPLISRSANRYGNRPSIT